eukprot:scaffold8214_cov121-Isochrysis_galbana.AAC.10
MCASSSRGSPANIKFVPEMAYSAAALTPQSVVLRHALRIVAPYPTPSVQLRRCRVCGLPRAKLRSSQ